MKEGLREDFLKKLKNIPSNNIFQYLEFLLGLVIMTVTLYLSGNFFEATWLNLVFQILMLVVIFKLSWGLSELTINIAERYKVLISKDILYSLTILLLAIIYMLTSFFMLFQIVSSVTKQGISSWFFVIFLIIFSFFTLVQINALLRAYYKDIEDEKIIVQAILLIFIFCYGIPGLVIQLSNTQLPGLIPNHYIIYINIFLAGGLSVSLQRFKNAYTNSIGNILFANYFQDFFALLIVLAALDLSTKKSILFYIVVIFFTTIFAGWRTRMEITKK